MNKIFTCLSAALCVAALCRSAGAAEATPPADPTKAVTTARVGGSAADAVFRTAQQESGAQYREARVACKAGVRAERSTCFGAARAEFKRTRLQAQAAHAASKKKQ